MIKVMLVDDERHVIVSLRKMIDWERLGFEICCEADNGFEAVKMVEAYCPDVIITDISMPDFDGLRLARHIKEKRQKTKIIMLTGYKSFNYARDAITIGVSEYLLKPVNKYELEELLKNLKTLIEEEDKNEKYLETLKTKADISEKIIKEKFMNWLLSGKQTLTDEEIISRFRFYKIPLRNDVFQVISVEFDKKEVLKNDETSILPTNELYRIVNEVFHRFENRFVFLGNDDRINIIVGYDSKLETAFHNILVYCEELKIYAMDLFHSSITIGIGSKHEGFVNIYKSYYEAVYALKYKFLLGCNRIISYDSIEISKIRNDYNANQKRNNILLRMRNYNNDEFRKAINSIFNELKGMDLSIEYIRTICLDMIFTGVLFANENSINIQDVFGIRYDPFEEMKTKESLDEVKDWILEYYNKLVEFSNFKRQSNPNKIIETALRIIKDDISNPRLSVKTVSEEIHVSKDYLSSLFKKEFGVPLIKYINKYRMEKAKEYMDKGCYNIGEISAKVGFENQFYFSTCFKGFFGVSPSKYLSNK